MKTEVLPTTEETVEKAAALLKTGAVVAFPTETVYGLGACGLNEQAVARIFEAKGRPADNPLIQHVADRAGLTPLVKRVPPEAEKLIATFWPGPLTIILESDGVVPMNARAGLPTVAVRCPANEWARGLIARCGFPIAAPSANRSGRPSPTAAAAVLEDMDGRIPLILDGGPCNIGLESTVLTLAAGKPRVLRPGGITPRQIAEVIGDVDVDASALRQLEPGTKAASPGMKYRHYAPRAALTVVAGEPSAAAEKVCALYDEAAAAGRSPAVLARAENVRLYGSREAYALGTAASPESVGTELFDMLRRMDADGRTDVFAEAVEPEGFGLAVMNRLLRAAGFRFIQV